MICIRKDLIEKELSHGEDRSSYKTFNLHNRLISKLKHHYICHEMCENFYDAEPKFDDEEFSMYMDYESHLKFTPLTLWHAINSESGRFSKEEHTQEEYKAAYEKIKKMYADFEEERLERLTWQEPYFDGNWHMSQKTVDKIALSKLKEIKKASHSNKNRLYMKEEKNMIWIYWYGRDYTERDYWFVFERK